MGFFSVNRFEEPGKGVDKDAPEKRRFFLFWEIVWRKLGKLISLSLLYTVMCIPVVTIGPATAGFVYVLRNFATREPTFVVHDFFDAFKKNWKSSFVVSLLDALVILLLGTAIPFYYSAVSQSTIFYIPLAVCLSGAFIAVMMNYYIYLMVVSLDLKLRLIIKNAFLLSCAAIKTNIITSLIVAVFVLGAYLTFPYLTIMYLIFMALIGFGFLGLVICFNSYRQILKYIVDPFYEKQSRVTPIDEQEEEANEEDEPIFKDIGSKEVPVKIDRKKHKNKTIR